MADSESVQSIVNQATTIVMVLSDADAGPRSAMKKTSPREPQTQRHGRPIHRSLHLIGMLKTSM